jgi:hypothetical protein
VTCFGGPILAALQLDDAAAPPPAWGRTISIPASCRSRLPCHTLHVVLSIGGCLRKSTRIRVAGSKSLATTLTPQVVSAAKPRLAAECSAPAPAWCPRFSSAKLEQKYASSRYAPQTFFRLRPGVTLERPSGANAA